MAFETLTKAELNEAKDGFRIAEKYLGKEAVNPAWEAMANDLIWAGYEKIAAEHHIQDLKAEWRKQNLTKEEREAIFLSDGSVTPHQAYESRRNYLENEYKEICKAIFMGGSEVLERKKKDIFFQYLSHTGEMVEKRITEMDIKRAKETPLTNFIKINRAKFANCPFHNEKTPSFFVKNNKFRCFGCGVYGDVIDFVMKLQGLGFIEAVKYLS